MLTYQQFAETYIANLIWQMGLQGWQNIEQGSQHMQSVQCAVKTQHALQKFSRARQSK